MRVYRSIEPGEAAPDSATRDLIESATRAAWLEQLAEAGLPVVERGAPEGAPRVHSLEPTTGDPQLLSVRSERDEGAWWVDRRTMRVNRAPAVSVLSEADVIAASDLADRAQLTLGRPITLVWFGERERLCISDLEPLSPRVSFTNASYRRTAPLTASPGTLCPLSVDILDQALRREQDAEHDRVVRRLYGQAYRRLDAGTRGRQASGLREQLARGLWRASRLASDLALPTADVARFRRLLAQEMPRDGAESLEGLDTEDLIDRLGARVALAAQALSLLERSRLATLSLLPLLNALAGPVSYEQLEALAEPIPSAQRRAVTDRLVALGHVLVRERGELVAPCAQDPDALRHAWARAKRTLANVRVPGMDVRPGPCGESDSELLRAVLEARSWLQLAEGERRRETERELLEAVRDASGPAAATTLARTALALLRRLARAKGDVVDGLSLALLRVRAVVLEAGGRLSRDGVLNDPDDAFFLELSELLQALRGEVGAYAARSRFRREDDLRWRHFEPPRRIGGRRSPLAPA